MDRKSALRTNLLFHNINVHLLHVHLLVELWWKFGALEELGIDSGRHLCVSIV